MMQIHQKIEQARVKAGLTQDELADKIGIKRTTYAYWEQKTPHIDKIMKVAEALELPIEYFFDENIVKPTNSENDKGEDQPGKSLLEQSVLNLTATQKINATSIDRLVALLEKAYGVTVLEEPKNRQGFGPELAAEDPNFEKGRTSDNNSKS